MSRNYVVAAMVAAIGLGGTTAIAQDKTFELKFNHALPATFPLVTGGFQAWADSIAKDSNGTIKFTFFPSSQLGATKDAYDITANNVAEISWNTPDYQPGRFPIVSLANAPFMMTNGIGGSAAVDDWYKRYAAREMKEVKVLITHVHAPGSFHFAKPNLKTAADIKGLKIRSAGGMISKWVSALGGANVQIPAPESRDAVVKGLVDGTTLPFGTLVAFKIAPATPYHVDDRFYVTVFNIVMNTSVYDSMSAAQKAVIDAHTTPQWAEKIGAAWANFEEGQREVLRKDPKHTFYELTAAERKAWIDSAKFLIADWEKEVTTKYGGAVDAKAALKDLQDTLKKYNSDYKG